MNLHQGAIPKDVEIDKDLKLLLTIGGLHALGIFLSNTFVNIYLWKQSGEFLDIALYNLAVYVLQPLTFIVAGKFAKKIDRVIVLRLGVSSLSLFFLTVLLVGENAATFNILLGALLGVGAGFYWLAFNVLIFEVTEPETRDFFNGFQGVLQSLGGAVGPVLAGYIISRFNNFQGYTIIFSISFIMFILAVISTMFMKRRSAEGKFQLRRILQERKHNKDWKRILHAHFSQGLREGMFVFVISIWVFITTQSELALGTFNLVFSGVSFFFYYVITRIIKPHMRKWSVFVGGLILYLAIFLILLETSYITLLIYGAIIGIGYPTLFVPYMSMTFDVIGRGWKAAEMRIEYIVVRELFTNMGRVSSIIIFISAITIFEPETAIPYLFLTLGIGHFAIYFFVKDVTITNPLTEHHAVKRELVEEENR
ncbi:MFS transporter [Radiobacillus deserti]|uniref:MFS transporter n=1 Tax=Radiobacillus deserti TaxID=2594883 RepID=A0A516KGW2_9BACI|nr:MFS transporter [Radiobacillus deserti]QDP40619.1 MFS transporter [Radiobacillus deserti]